MATQASVKHDKKINVWGCFSAHGVGNLFRIHGIMLKEHYNNILISQMVPSAQRLFPNQNWIFQQDNDPKHTAIINKTWVANNNISTFEWPAQSPDLNPIENLWSILDKQCRDRRPGNENELFQILEEKWKSLDISLLTKLVDSMPKRCQAVIDSKGYPTKY